MLKYIPNALTCLRIALAPCFVILYLLGQPAAAVWVFAAGAVTDVLDGFIARRFNCITTAGKALDPLADKITLIAVLMCLFIAKRVPLWLLLILVVRELLMILGGVILWQNRLTFSSDKFGKVTTVLFSAAALLLFPWHNVQPLITVGNALMLLSLASSLISFWHYARRYLARMGAKQPQTK